ncbi:MAG: hypothetical protein ACE5OZ_13555 [Candidatus Heimdallarchaeota archaeon]
MRKFTCFKGLALTLFMVLSFLQVASAISDSSPSDESIPEERNSPVIQTNLSSVDQNKIVPSDTEDHDRAVNPQIPNPTAELLSQGPDDQVTFSRDNNNLFRQPSSPFPFLENPQNAHVPPTGGSIEEQRAVKSSLVPGTEVAIDILPENNTWTDSAIDDDGNGFYDRLVIDIGRVNQTANQAVVLIGTLKDETGQWLGYSQNSTSDTPGDNISLSFAAQPINASGIDGRYNVWIHLFSIGAYLPGFNFSLAYTTFQTYNHNDFEAPSAEMVGFSDYALDTDDDLLLDEIIINVSLLVKETGHYTVGVLLGSSDPFSPAAQLLMQTESKYLTPGNRSIEIHFSGGAFFTAQLNGPYNLGFAFLSVEDDSGDFSALQFLTDAYNTSSYRYSDFDLPAAFLTGRYWEQGIDTNGNGRYDQFEITLEINATQEGRYRINLALRPSNQSDPVLGVQISDPRYLISGVQNTSVLTETNIFYSQRLNTSYVISQIMLYDHKYEIVDQAFSAYTTQIYDYNEFDLPGASLTGKYSDHGADADSDGKFDQVVVVLEVNVTQPGDYYINLDVTAVANEFSDSPNDFSVGTAGFWETGVQNISVAIETHHFYQWGLSYSLRISTAVITTSDGNFQDQAYNSYTTRVYSYDEFDIPEAFLTGNYADRGSDTDLDGKFDQLLIDVEVNVTQEGTYNLYISLKTSVESDYSGSNYLWGSRERWLRPGVYIFTVTFETHPVYSWRLNTSFIIGSIELYLSEENPHTVDRAFNSYTTRVYSFVEFDRPGVELTGDYWDEGADSDSSGKFDQLVIHVGVNVSEAASYRIELNLGFDDFTDLRGETNPYLDVGVWNVTVRIENWALAYLEHFDTAFIIERIEIRGYYYNTLDQAYLPYTTRMYHYTEFDPPGAFLTGEYWDYGADTDDDDKYDLLILVIGINVTRTGYYSLDLSLESSRPGNQNDAIRFWGSADREFWIKGARNVSVHFETTSIYHHRVNTSFLIESVNLHDFDWETLDQESYPYSTRSYSFDEFDIPGAQLTGVYSDQGIDWDSDGKFDVLRISARINVTEAGTYELSMHIHSRADEHFWDSAYGYSPVGLQLISVFIDGFLIYGTHQNSDYRLVEVSIRDENSNILDTASDVYTTDFYLSDQFNPPRVAIVGIYADQGVDFDYDGDFEFLAIVVGIQVDKPAICFIRVEGLFDQYGNLMWVHGESLPVYYPVGLFNVTVYLQGPDIRNLASSSPWTTVNVVLFDENYQQLERLDVDYRTRTYDAFEFVDSPWSNDRPPSIGGLIIDMGTVEKDFAVGDSIQLRVAAADNDEIREVQLYINGDDITMWSASEPCPDCGFWRASYARSYTFDDPGTYEFYAVAVDFKDQFSGKSNIVKIVIPPKSTPNRNDFPGFTIDMLIGAGVVFLLAWGSGWRKRKKDC